MTNHTLQKQLIQVGATFAGVAVALGAFGAHQLKDLIDETELNTFETGIRYQFYHAISLFLIGGVMRRFDEKTVKQVFQLFVVGILIFSGSLYILATRHITLGDNLKWIGGLTPIGGVCFILGWFLLAFKGYKKTDGTETNPYRHRSRSSKNQEEENSN